MHMYYLLTWTRLDADFVEDRVPLDFFLLFCMALARWTSAGRIQRITWLTYKNINESTTIYTPIATCSKHVGSESPDISPRLSS